MSSTPSDLDLKKSEEQKITNERSSSQSASSTVSKEKTKMHVKEIPFSDAEERIKILNKLIEEAQDLDMGY